uniref:Uncharacterized protein n=1 Tax=Timema tahoe TaxID=61484 RepID=A0A7R9NV23_9NEOP|nr:unnamed protein product [Timema tahoe]
MSNELTAYSEIEYITEFVPGGPKNYSYNVFVPETNEYRISPRSILALHHEIDVLVGAIDEDYRDEVTYESTHVKDSLDKEEWVEEESYFVPRSESDKIETCSSHLFSSIAGKYLSPYVLRRASTDPVFGIRKEGDNFKIGNSSFTGEDNDIYLDADNLNTDVRLKILDAILFVKHVEVSPTISLAIEKTLLRKPAQYHINRLDVKPVTVPKRSKSVSLNNVIQGAIPKIVLFTMVSNDAFVGSLNINPF